MRAVVMAGGRGTRMLPYTTVLPKPLLPVGERPILAILLEQLAAAGTTRIDLCVGYLGELIRAYLLETPLRLRNAEIVLHTESQPLGTAGALHEIPALEEPFLSQRRCPHVARLRCADARAPRERRGPDRRRPGA